jgi:hypothetical protein
MLLEMRASYILQVVWLRDGKTLLPMLPEWITAVFRPVTNQELVFDIVIHVTCLLECSNVYLQKGPQPTHLGGSYQKDWVAGFLRDDANPSVLLEEKRLCVERRLAIGLIIWDDFKIPVVMVVYEHDHQSTSYRRHNM